MIANNLAPMTRICQKKKDKWTISIFFYYRYLIFISSSFSRYYFPVSFVESKCKHFHMLSLIFYCSHPFYYLCFYQPHVQHPRWCTIIVIIMTHTLFSQQYPWRKKEKRLFIWFTVLNGSNKMFDLELIT